MVTKERLSLRDIAGRSVMSASTGEKAYQVVIGVLMAIALGVGGYANKRLDEIAALKTQVELLSYRIEELGKDGGMDEKQNDSISKHWVLHGWAKDELSQLRAEHGLGLARWPSMQ